MYSRRTSVCSRHSRKTHNKNNKTFNHFSAHSRGPFGIENRKPQSYNAMSLHSTGYPSLKIVPVHLRNTRASKHLNRQLSRHVRFQNAPNRRNKNPQSQQPSLSYQQIHKNIKQNRNQLKQMKQPLQQSQSISFSRPSYASTVGTEMSVNTSKTVDFSFLPHQIMNEKPTEQIQHEIKYLTTPTLNLSSYGYSINITEPNIRKKALDKALKVEGYSTIKKRLTQLGSQNISSSLIQNILDDLKWLEKYKANKDKKDSAVNYKEQITATLSRSRNRFRRKRA